MNLHGQTAVQTEHRSPGFAFSGDPPPRNSSPAVSRRRPRAKPPPSIRSETDALDEIPIRSVVSLAIQIRRLEIKDNGSLAFLLMSPRAFW